MGWILGGIHDLADQVQVLSVLMSGKQQLSTIELGQNAPDGPDIRWIRPLQIQYHLGAPVLSRVDDRGMMVRLESGSPKVNQPNLIRIAREIQSRLFVANILTQREDTTHINEGQSAKGIQREREMQWDME